MATPAYVSAGRSFTYKNTASTTITLSLGVVNGIGTPYTPAAGDLVVAWVWVGNGSDVAATAPAGWTQLFSAFNASGPALYVTAFYQYFSSAAAGSTVVFNWTGSGASGTAAQVFTGTYSANPIDRFSRGAFQSALNYSQMPKLDPVTPSGTPIISTLSTAFQSYGYVWKLANAVSGGPTPATSSAVYNSTMSPLRDFSGSNYEIVIAPMSHLASPAEPATGTWATGEVESATTTCSWSWSGGSIARGQIGGYLSLNAVPPTGKTVAISEVVTDSLAPTAAESTTGGSTIISETIADSRAPTTTDSQLGASIVTAETVTDSLAPASATSPRASTVDIGEVVTDSTAPTTTDAQTGAQITVAEVVADSLAPTTTDAQTGAPVTAVAADANNGVVTVEQLIANTVVITTDASSPASSSKSLATAKTISTDEELTGSANASAATSGSVASELDAVSLRRDSAADRSGTLSSALDALNSVVEAALRALGSPVDMSQTATGEARGSVEVQATTVAAAAAVANLRVKVRNKGRPGSVVIRTLTDAVSVGFEQDSVDLRVAWDTVETDYEVIV